MTRAPEGIFVHYSQARQDWETPREMFGALDAEFGFTLDVCATPANAKCERFFTPAIDGLAQDWGSSVCWCNPPYGSAVAAWIRKAFESSQHGATVVCLVPSRTDTEWWHSYAMRGDVRFIKRRVPFVRPDGQRSRAPFPSALVVFRAVSAQDDSAGACSTCGGSEKGASVCSNPFHLEGQWRNGVQVADDSARGGE